MGRIAAVLSFERVDELDEKTVQVKIDLGGKNFLTPEQYSPPGIDAPPMGKNEDETTGNETIGDYAVTVDTPGNSGESVVGYVDPYNEGVAEGGECRLYSRDEDGGIAIALYLKKDGTIEFGADTDNLVRYSEMAAAFNDLQDQVQEELLKIFNALASFPIPSTNPYVPVPLTATIVKAKIEEFLAPEWEAPE